MDNPDSPQGQPAPLHTITTLEALKVFSDPLRQQIIEALLDGPKTVKQIAADLDLAPTKLYYHVNLLEEHDLIKVTETRIVSGIIEKHYVAAAHEYRIERALLTPGQNPGGEVLKIAFDAMIDPIRDELRRSFTQGLIDMSPDAEQHKRFRMWRAPSRLTPEQAEVFYARLMALVDEFNAATKDDDANPEKQAYSLLVSIYPTVNPKKPTKS